MSENVRKLTPAQQRAVLALASGRSVVDAGAAAGVTDRTVRRWRELDGFADAVEREATTVLGEARRRIAGGVERAAATVTKLADPDAELLEGASVRLAAARDILDRTLGKAQQLVENSGEIVGDGTPRKIEVVFIDPPKHTDDSAAGS